MKSEQGIAMVLAMTLLGLLSSLGIYLVLGSGTSYRIAKSAQRVESSMNLADSAVQLGLRCVKKSPPSPSYLELTSEAIQPVTAGLPTYMKQQSLGAGVLTPYIDYIGYKSTPPPGWMINWQGYSSFYSLYLRARGTATITVTTAQGNTQATASCLVVKVTR